MATGSNNAQQCMQIIQKVEASNIISGSPGTWSVSSVHAVAAASPRAPLAAGAPAVAPLLPGEVSAVETAVAQSNAAATTTPSAVTGNPTTGNTPETTISNVLQGISDVGSTIQDIKKLEAGATATLHWWGWSLTLTEDATQALLRLLGTDIKGLVTVTTALAVTSVSAPLAAVGAIITAVVTAISGWITEEDDNHKGVLIRGFGVLGVWVTGQ